MTKSKKKRPSLNLSIAVKPDSVVYIKNRSDPSSRTQDWPRKLTVCLECRPTESKGSNICKMNHCYPAEEIRILLLQE